MERLSIGRSGTRTSVRSKGLRGISIEMVGWGSLCSSRGPSESCGIRSMHPEVYTDVVAAGWRQIIRLCLDAMPPLFLRNACRRHIDDMHQGSIRDGWARTGMYSMSPGCNLRATRNVQCLVSISQHHSQMPRCGMKTYSTVSYGASVKPGQAVS